MKNLNIYGSLFLAMSSCFTLGAYVCSTIKYNQPIELSRWIYTITFGLIFFINFLHEFKQQDK